MAESVGGGDTDRVGPFEELYRVGLFDESVEWGGAAYLMMDFNKLVGTIPPELGKLTQLSGWLSLEGNSLTGTIPQSFVGFTNATWIYLNQNDLTGSAEFLCDALKPVEGYGYTNVNSTSPLLELWVDREEVNCTCCNCCPVKPKNKGN
eukprot:scaffold12198_cov85-Skeletonema_dohrnii-CCMP3373.AAC.2